MSGAEEIRFDPLLVAVVGKIDRDRRRSWVGQCLFDISTFEFEEVFVGSRVYRVGGSVTCASDLDVFIAPDKGPLTLRDVDYNGTISFD